MSRILLRRQGFTIVELLIVIVVIGILAAITVVAYNGVQTRAKSAAVQSLVGSTAKKVSLYKAATGQYPTYDELVNNRAPGSVVNNSGPAEAQVSAANVSNFVVTPATGQDTVRYVRAADGLCAWLDWWDFNNDRTSSLSTTPPSRRIDC